MSRKKKDHTPMTDDQIATASEASESAAHANSNGRKGPKVRKEMYYRLIGTKTKDGPWQTIKTTQTVGRAVKYYDENALLINSVYELLALERVYLLDPLTGKHVVKAAPVAETSPVAT